MSKERLEEIKRQSEYIELSNAENFIVYKDMKIKKEHYDRLIQQGERVEELEKEKDEWKDTAQAYFVTNQELREQNKRYREELDILGEVINSAPNADKLNEEYERLKGLEGEE